jgi:hypothetical protein
MNLYPNPTAPLIPLCPKSPVGETGRGENLTAAVGAPPPQGSGGTGYGGTRSLAVDAGGGGERTYSDAKSRKNRNTKVWHGMIERGP